MTTQQRSSKTLIIILWLAQGLLAATFIWAGGMKILNPSDLPFTWIKENAGLALFTGFIDLFAGVGIALPALLRIKTKVTIFAGYGIVVLMIAASIFHISRGEIKDIGFNIFMLLIAFFVAWGRQKKAPITNK